MRTFIIIFLLTTTNFIFCDIFEDLKIPENEISKTRTFADKILKSGFPNAKGGEFFVGEIHIISIIDPSKEDAPFPISASFMQSTMPNGNLMEYRFKFNGPHVRLKDGSWLILFQTAFKESKQNKLKLKNTYQVFPDKIFNEAQKKHSFDLSKSAVKWTLGYPKDKREHICSIMNKVIPITYYLKIRQDQVPYALLLLHSAGMKEAPLLVYSIADTRSRNYWQQAYWSKTPGPFDPSGRYPGLGKRQKEWHKKSSAGYQFEKLDIAFRRSLQRLFMYAILQPKHFINPDKAARLAKLCLDPKDPQDISKKIDILLETIALPDLPKKKSSLVEKLRSWGFPKKPKLAVTKGGGKTSMRTGFIKPKEAYTPKLKDLKQLFQLLNDKRSTKFIDYQGGRSVDENAMRAISIVMKRNVLELIKMEALEPWSSIRKTEAVKKLQLWWIDHPNDYEKFIINKK